MLNILIFYLFTAALGAITGMTARKNGRFINQF